MQMNSFSPTLRASFLSVLVILPIWCLSQAPERAYVMEQGRAHAKVLASPEMKGRGYQDEGALKAARYIAEKFKSYGLEPLPRNGMVKNPYFQDFKFSTNLVDDLALTLNGTEMKEGHQFIAAAVTSRGSTPETKVFDLGYGMPKDFKKSYEGGIVMFRSGLPPKKAKKEEYAEKFKEFRSDQAKVALAKRRGAKGIIVVKPKLTASLRPVTVDLPVLEVEEDELPRRKIKQGSMSVDANLTKVSTQNVLGMIKGKVEPDSVIILCGHYDHLGTQGEAIFYGGNDNASGTSLLLTLAEHFSKPENQPDYTLAFIAFSGEEAGLHGSRYYVKNPMIPLEKTTFVLNMDLMANGDEGITAVAGYDYPEQFELLESLNEKRGAVPVVKRRGNSANSDHYFFTKAGVPALFIFTMGGPPHYHDVNDTYEEMQFSRFFEVHELFVDFLGALMQMHR